MAQTMNKLDQSMSLVISRDLNTARTKHLARFKESFLDIESKPEFWASYLQWANIGEDTKGNIDVIHTMTTPMTSFITMEKTLHPVFFCLSPSLFYCSYFIEVPIIIV